MKKAMKKPEEIEIPLFDEILAQTSQDSKLFVENSLAIANQIVQILDKNNMSQKELADRMGKKEAEISRWLKGFHNFTIRSISKIEAALGEKIMSTPSQMNYGLMSDTQLNDYLSKIKATNNREIHKSFVKISKDFSCFLNNANTNEIEFSQFLAAQTKSRIVA